ncbi:MAG: ABC transporter ATP-binding protein [Oscillospiraceae bacterium]|nr:ABC transporter ATP-binding protein [Oscillospiraceae bacterium]
MLEIKDLKVSFTDDWGGEAVDGASLRMNAGERLGLVGESGSGKTMLALTVAGLIPRSRTEVTGEILFEGADLLKRKPKELRSLQGKDIGMIFQEPMTSLNPLMRIGKQIEEALKLHTGLCAQRRREKALEVMELVELPEPELTYAKYPHQLSGGQRQRAMIASAFITDPKLLIADEPTTALDVTVQGQIIKLLKRLNENRGVGILFISHDLSVIRKLCTRVAVMHAGKIVEQGNTEDVFTNPQHEYTKRLIAAIPTREKRSR